MAGLRHDIRIAARSVMKARLVSALAFTAFALGIGITTAVFSIFNGVLLQPLPYPQPEQIVAVYDTQPACATCPASFPKYHDWKDRNRVFAAMAGASGSGFVLTGRGEAARVTAMITTASLADVLRVGPAIGRWYSDAEDQEGGPKVVVLAHGFWTRVLGGDAGMIGQTLLLNGEPYEVIGVMPPSFTFGLADVYVPLQRKLDPATRRSHFLPVYARLRDGVGVEQAAAEMRALGATLAREFDHNHGIDVRSYTEAVVGSVRTPLAVLMGAVVLVLFIACANVANLLLASGLARRRELAIRLALGARVRDLARQLTLESLLLACAGGVAGVLLATWLVQAFVALAGTQLPRASTIAIDVRVVAFAALVSVGVGIGCGLMPLALMRARQLTGAIREGDTRTVSGSGRLGNGLVVAEIAFAFALLVGAGLLVKNLMLLGARDAGLTADRIVAFDLAPTGARYKEPARVLALYRELQERLTAMDIVESAGMISHLPMQNFGWNGEFQIEGGTPWGPNDAPLVEYRWMYGEYVRTLGIPLVQGRLLDARDGEGSRTVLVNEAMAAKFWPGQDPIGKRFGQNGQDPGTWFEVVGVLGNTRSLGLQRDPPFEFYRTIEQSPFAAMSVVVRTRSEDPTSIMPTVRQIVTGLDPSLPLARVQTLEQVVAASIGRPRLLSALTALFGALAGLLATVGVYGMMAYNVRRQRREFGIRLALGAAQGTVGRLVVTRGLRLSMAGIGLGALGAWALSGVLTSLLHDVQPTDPGIFVGVAALTLSTALLASFVPARAASRVDPLIVLRDN